MPSALIAGGSRSLCPHPQSSAVQAAPNNFVVQLDLAKTLLMPLDRGPGQLDSTHLQVLMPHARLSRLAMVLARPALSWHAFGRMYIPKTTGGCAGAGECCRDADDHERATYGSRVQPCARAGLFLFFAFGVGLLSRPGSFALSASLHAQVAIAAQHIGHNDTTQRQVRNDLE